MIYVHYDIQKQPRQQPDAILTKKERLLTCTMSFTRSFFVTWEDCLFHLMDSIKLAPSYIL